MSVASSPPNWLRPFAVLASFALVLWLLSWLQPVLIPVALAILLTFMLGPVVTLLQRRGVHRTVAVVLVVLTAFSFIGGVGYAVARQVNSLVDVFPQYEQNLQKKIESAQSESGFIDRMQRIIKRVTRQVERKPSADTADPIDKDPMPVTVISDGGPFQLGRIWSVFGPILGPFAAVGLAVVLVIFMLLRREDLRDRIISLVGHGHGRLTLTTKALDEAAERISRFLLMQLIINGSYGVVVGVGLNLIGVPFALLWGFFAAVLRYIPYLGPWLAAILPIGLSLLVSDGWSAPLMVVGLFLALELVSNMIIEPWLYGRGIGVSETATLIMIAFWTWLWGPIGLVLATPLTVCVVVLGKYVPFLSFFDTLLGDRPALEAHVSYYQRMLARDQDEAAEIARNHLGEHSLTETYDRLLIPALVHAKRDVAGDYLSEDDQRFVLETTRAVLEEVSTLASAAAPAASAAEGVGAVAVPTMAAKVPLLACPARDEADEIAATMLKALLDSGRCDVTIATTALLANEIVARVDEIGTRLLCIAALPPGGIAQTRLLCLRLRARFPLLKIIVGRFGIDGNTDKLREQLTAAGVDHVTTTLDETIDLLDSLVQVELTTQRETEPAAPARSP